MQSSSPEQFNDSHFRRKARSVRFCRCEGTNNNRTGGPRRKRHSPRLHESLPSLRRNVECVIGCRRILHAAGFAFVPRHLPKVLFVTDRVLSVRNHATALLDPPCLNGGRWIELCELAVARFALAGLHLSRRRLLLSLGIRRTVPVGNLSASLGSDRAVLFHCQGNDPVMPLCPSTIMARASLERNVAITQSNLARQFEGKDRSVPAKGSACFLDRRSKNPIV